MAEFINPYTFVPVDKGGKKPYDEYYRNAELISGKIKCTLKTRTQIAVCDMISETEADFFRVDGKAVIPGSGIRGTIRSIFEALTDSCFSSVNAENDDYFSSRLNKEKPALIEYDSNEDRYILYDAVRYKDDNNDQLGKYRTGDEVRFNYYSRDRINYLKEVNERDTFKKGYVHKVERFKSKINGKFVESKDSIFERKGSGKVISHKSVELLGINLDVYETKKDTRISIEYKNQFAKMKRGEGLLPVWYYQNGDRYYFAPSQMSRAIFYTQPIDMLKKRNLDRCSNKNRVCETCAMFGIIGKQGESFSASSRIRFSDAICEDENCFDGKYNLILASPRISSFEFYLKSRSSQYCADDDGVTIAGRKYYWHHNSEIKNVDVTTANQKMVRKVELVKSGSEFTFYIYFDNITEVQLKKLVFALNLGENSLDSDKCHKIGHGKPLGLGSVKIVVDSIKMRIFRCGKYGETSGDELIADSKGDIFDNKKNVENILKVTDMNAVESGIVHYPKTDKSGDIFKWFAENRKVLKSFGASMEYYTKLPLLTDDSQELPSSPKIGKTYAGRDFGYNQNNEKSHNTFFSTVRTKESRHDKPKGKRK